MGGAWNVNNGKSTKDDANDRDSRPKGFKAATFDAIGGGSSDEEMKPEKKQENKTKWQEIKDDWSETDEEEEKQLKEIAEKNKQAREEEEKQAKQFDKEDGDDQEYPPTPGRSENGEEDQAELENDGSKKEDLNKDLFNDEEEMGDDDNNFVDMDKKEKSDKKWKELERSPTPDFNEKREQKQSPRNNYRRDERGWSGERDEGRRSWRDQRRERSPPSRRQNSSPLRRRSPPRAHR